MMSKKPASMKEQELMTYRLLALDLDGTLLDQRMTITPAVRAAAKAASERGVTITIATGRTFRATMPYVQALGVSGPVICYQGGAIFDSQSGAMSNPVYVPAALAAQGAQMMLERGLFCLIYADEKIYIADDTRPELAYYRSFHPEGLDLVVAPDLPAVAQHAGVLKVQFTAEPALIDRFQPDFQAAFQGQLDVLRSHDHYLELIPQNISKGTALEALAHDLGIPREQVMAIGDHMNDIEMIRWAGLGLAMGNGAPEAHAAAKAVIPTVAEDGVAWAIQRYILG